MGSDQAEQSTPVTWKLERIASRDRAAVLMRILSYPLPHRMFALRHASDHRNIVPIQGCTYKQRLTVHVRRFCLKLHKADI